MLPIKNDPVFDGKQDRFWIYNKFFNRYHLIQYTQFGDKVYCFHHYLGTVKKKNDGRFEWTFIDRPFFCSKSEGVYKQGVCGTMEEAAETVERLHNLGEPSGD